MDIGAFDYDLPDRYIAQTPLVQRDASNLLVVDRTGPFQDRVFRELGAILPSESLIVLNDTRVFPARLRARKPEGGRVEILLVRPQAGLPAVERDPAGPAPDRSFSETWNVICRPARRIRSGLELSVEPPRHPGPGSDAVRDPDAGRVPDTAPIRAFVEEVTGAGNAVMRFEGRGPGGLIRACADLGEVPLPPYIKRPSGPLPADREQYQTVYAALPGAVAAPTAGFHFTPELLSRLERDGFEFARLTLHVGPGTFLPVRTRRVEDHRMHGEWYCLPEPTAEAIHRAKGQGRPVVAVGTTVMRVLETCAEGPAAVRAGEGETDLFIVPGFEFRVVDLLLTNFHLPRTTLLMLVCAFGGHQRVLQAYRHAVDRQYRFYSYGDAMLVFKAG